MTRGAKTKQRMQLAAMVLVGGIVGLAGGYVVGKSIHAGGHGSGGHVNLGIEMGALLLACFLPVAAHEAGHVLAGLTVGFRFAFYVAGPICFQRKEDRIRFVFHGNPRLWGPRAGCYPQTHGPELRMKMLWFTAGGPLASLLGGAAAWPGLGLRATHPVAAQFLIFFGVVSLGLAAATMIPMTISGSTSDGARILMLLRDTAKAKRWVALGALSGMSRMLRPKEWPEGLMEMLGEGLDGEPDAVSVCLFRFFRHQDRKEWGQAGAWLERGLANIEAYPPAFRSGLLYCAAQYEARQEGDAVQARAHFDRAAGFGYSKPEDLPGVAAAVLIAEGRRDEARIWIERAEGKLKSDPPGIAAVRREEIEELRADLG